jgi:PAS domain S-box-containing protein
VSKESIREKFLRSLSTEDLFLEDLMDMFPDISLSVKDRHGRYVSASRSLLTRLGLKKRTDIVGRRPEDLFPESMAARYVEQDERVLATGAPVCNNLDVTIYPDGSHGWCLTSKFPLRDARGRVAGLACISKDINSPFRYGLVSERLAETVDYILANFERPLRLGDLAKMSALTVPQLERRFKKVFGETVMQFIQKTRLHAAMQMLESTDEPIASVAVRSGFCDQSALTRRLKSATGFTPRQYRKRFRGGEAEER